MKIKITTQEVIESQKEMEIEFPLFIKEVQSNGVRYIKIKYEEGLRVYPFVGVAVWATEHGHSSVSKTILSEYELERLMGKCEISDETEFYNQLQESFSYFIKL